MCRRTHVVRSAQLSEVDVDRTTPVVTRDMVMFELSSEKSQDWAKMRGGLSKQNQQTGASVPHKANAVQYVLCVRGM